MTIMKVILGEGMTRAFIMKTVRPNKVVVTGKTTLLVAEKERFTSYK